MKISKLFHWLYAILMLLPFVFFVPSVLYYAFNDNATMQTVEVPKTETVAVDFNQLIDDGYEFHCDFSNSSYNFVGNSLTLNNEYYLRVYVKSTSLSVFSFGYTDNRVYTYNTYYTGTGDYVLYEYRFSNSYTFLGEPYFFVRIESPIEGSVLDFKFFEAFNLTQMFGSGNEPTIAEFNLMLPNDYYSYTESQPMQITYDTGESEQLVENTSIINYAWESVWDLPLFSWTKVSFVAVPFTYITGLFGLAPSNSFNYVFTYFASMSIIWLVFDVILYVPLLVHRWLDKGIVE